jgi:membrane protease YdiL (CAAX protease family)
MSRRIDRSMRVPPRPLIGIVIWAAYAIYAVVSVLPSGIDVDELADTPSNLIKGIVIPLGPGAAALLAAVYVMGWWRPVFHEERRSPRWTLLIAALLGLGVVVALLRTDWGGTEGSLILWLAVATLCIAVAEETLCRGILVTALRGGVGEVGSSVCQQPGGAGGCGSPSSWGSGAVPSWDAVGRDPGWSSGVGRVPV